MRLTARARALRRSMTEAERTLWRLLCSRALGGTKFRRQHPIPPFIADFACLSARIVIEIDGGQHGGAADAARDAALARAGWRVLRFWNTEVLANPEGVLERILGALHGEPPHPDPLPTGEREPCTTTSRGAPSPACGRGTG